MTDDDIEYPVCLTFTKQEIRAITKPWYWRVIYCIKRMFKQARED